MKELINNKNKKIPLIFKCKKCGSIFISNEYKSNEMILHSTLKYETSEETCVECKNKVIGGSIYSPLLGSDERKKWYGD